MIFIDIKLFLSIYMQWYRYITKYQQSDNDNAMRYEIPALEEKSKIW